jgi:hypothetical protein
LRWIGPLGGILFVIGLILTPFIVGLPIMVAGWLFLVFGFFYSKYRAWVPQKYRDKLRENLKKEYAPYEPTIKGLGSIILEMLKVAALVFIGGIILIVFFLFR